LKRLIFDCSRIDSTFGDHQNPAQKGGFVNITGVVAKQVAQEGISGEIFV
jgi:hypothetical protein